MNRRPLDRVGAARRWRAEGRATDIRFRKEKPKTKPTKCKR
jgi:hypothetical protein